MNKKLYLFVSVGTSLLLSFGITYFVRYSYDNEMQRKISDNLKSHTIYVNNVDYQEQNEVVTTNSDYQSIDDSELYAGVSSDQKAKKVKSYKRVLSIPSLKIKAYIYEGVGRDALTYGVGRYTNSGKLGKKGNMVIAGHSSDIYNCILNGLHDIKLYSVIRVYDDSGKKHNYYVVNTEVVYPDAFYIFDKLTDYNQLTLFTCTEHGTKRFVVYAYEMSDREFKDYKYSVNRELYSSMEDINDSIEVEPIQKIIDMRGRVLEDNSISKLDILISEANKSLLDRLNDNESIFNMFNKEVMLNDISEN